MLGVETFSVRSFLEQFENEPSSDQTRAYKMRLGTVLNHGVTKNHAQHRHIYTTHIHTNTHTHIYIYIYIYYTLPQNNLGRVQTDRVL
jgi:hypothetical protein